MTEHTVDIVSPVDGSVVGQARYAGSDEVEKAIAAAAAAVPAGRALPAYVRAGALDHIVARITERADEFAALITAENGKPAQWAEGEVARAVSTFRWAAEEARRFNGELQRLDTDPGGTGRVAVLRRFARGAVLGITPFNFPLNLVAHKVAPAIAVGAPILLKPAPKTPLSALLLGEIVAETELPPGMMDVVLVPDAAMPALVADERLPVVSFTGSERVGWAIRDAVPRKHVTLELGGNAAAVVAPDYADLDRAAQRIATFGNYQAGQSCISVQRVLVDAGRYEEFVKLLVDKVNSLDFDTVVGPVINAESAERIESWIGEAVAAGARVLTGGTRRGQAVAPTVLADVPATAKVVSEEVFGPVLVVGAYDTVEGAFAQVNDSRHGLQTGLFTNDIHLAFAADRALDVGGVVVGDVPSFRADQMPYGGQKQSGVGREGVRCAMDDYTEVRTLVLTDIDL